MSPFRKILLPIDMLSADGPLSTTPVLRALEALRLDASTELEGACVLSPATLNVSRDDLLEHCDSYRALVVSQLMTLLGGWASRVRLSAKAIAVFNSSLQASTQELLNHAEKENFDLIALATHSRKGLDRFFLGSFAETLMLNAHHALLTTNPHSGESEGRAHFLVPTNCDSDEAKFVTRAIGLAREVGARVTLLHLVRPTAPLTLTTEYLGEDAIERRIDEGRARLERFAATLSSAGVPLGFEIDVALISLGDSIAENARRLNASLVVQATGRERPLFSMLGSTARRVVRKAPCPVLTLPRPHE